MKKILIFSIVLMIAALILTILFSMFYEKNTSIETDTNKEPAEPATTNEWYSSRGGEILLGRNSSFSVEEHDNLLAKVTEIVLAENNGDSYYENLELISYDSRYVAYRVVTVRGPSRGSVVDLETNTIFAASIPNYLILSTPTTAIFMDYYSLYEYTIGATSTEIIAESVISVDDPWEKESYDDCSGEFPPFAYSTEIHFSDTEFELPLFGIVNQSCLLTGARAFALPEDFRLEEYTLYKEQR